MLYMLYMSNHWSTIGQPFANHWPTVRELLANHWPTIGPPFANHWPTIGPWRCGYRMHRQGIRSCCRPKSDHQTVTSRTH